MTAIADALQKLLSLAPHPKQYAATHGSAVFQLYVADTGATNNSKQ
jgi:hypothetical protein